MFYVLIALFYVLSFIFDVLHGLFWVVSVDTIYVLFDTYVLAVFFRVFAFSTLLPLCLSLPLSLFARHFIIHNLHCSTFAMIVIVLRFQIRTNRQILFIVIK